MKKINAIILLTLSLAVSFTFGQGSYKTASDGTPGASRADEFQCLPDAVFSQVHPTFDDGFWGDDQDPQFGSSELIDDYSASGSFQTLRFWGSNAYRCEIGATQTFNIKFYEKNPGNPNQLGPLVYSDTYVVTPLDLGISGWNTPFYQVDINLGATITLLEGWVSIQRANKSDLCTFAGPVSYLAGGNAATYAMGTYYFQDYGVDLLFCLGGQAEEIPVSPMALIIGVALIGIFVVLRTRRTI